MYKCYKSIVDDVAMLPFTTSVVLEMDAIPLGHLADLRREVKRGTKKDDCEQNFKRPV